MILICYVTSHRIISRFFLASAVICDVHRKPCTLKACSKSRIGVESQLATHGETVEWADLAEIGRSAEEQVKV